MPPPPILVATLPILPGKPRWGNRQAYSVKPVSAIGNLLPGTVLGIDI